MRLPAGVFCALAFLSAGAAILSPHAAGLMVGAHGISRRKRWGVAVCFGWAVVHALLAVIDVAQMPEYWQRGRSGGFQRTPLRMQIALWKLVWGFAFPLFLLGWFGRESVRRDVRAWGKAAGPL